MLELNISQQLVTVVIASVVLVSTYSSWITTEDCDLDVRARGEKCCVCICYISNQLRFIGSRSTLLNLQSILYIHTFVATIEHFPISTCPSFIHFTIFSLHSVFSVFFGVGWSFIHSPSMIKKHHQHQEYLRGRKQPTGHGK